MRHREENLVPTTYMTHLTHWRRRKQRYFRVAGDFISVRVCSRQANESWHIFGDSTLPRSFAMRRSHFVLIKDCCPCHACNKFHVYHHILLIHKACYSWRRNELEAFLFVATPTNYWGESPHLGEANP